MKSKNPLHKRILTGILWCTVIFTLVFSMLQYFGVSFDVSAGYARTLPFQGRLTNPNGTNVTNGKYNMIFRIFNTPSQMVTLSPLWEEHHTGTNAVTVEDSVFNVLLGKINSINLDFNSGTYWLEIQVDNEILSPRRQIGGTGYSINTDNVTGVPGSIFDTNLNAFPASKRAVIDALNYLLGQIGTAGLWTDTGTTLRPRVGVSGNVSIPGGTLNVSGATTLSSTLGVSGATNLGGTLVVSGATNLNNTLGVAGAVNLGSTLVVAGTITGPTSNTINGLSIDSGTITDGVWNGTQISDSYVVALDGASQGDILYHNGVQWTQLSAGTSGNFLMTQGLGANPVWNSVGGGALADGTVVNSTLHWSGGTWAENIHVLTTHDSLYSDGELTIYSTGADLTLATNTSGNIFLDSTGGYIQAQDSLRAIAGIDITNAPLTMGTQSITGVGTNITAAGALTVTSVGAGNDLSLVSADKIYFQDALITTPIPFALTDNTAAFESVFAAADRGIIDALISLASGGTGLWLDNVGDDYLYPNSNYSNNVAISSGTLGVGTTPSASIGVSSEITGSNVTGVLGSARGSNTTLYGVYGRARAGDDMIVMSQSYGVYGIADGIGQVNYGVYGTASNADTNWAGYFVGDVYSSGKFISGETITIDGNANTIATTASSLGVTATGAVSDLTLGARGASITLNELGQTTLSGFTATSIIGALNELVGGGGAGLWLHNVGGDYLYPDATYSNNVAIPSGTLGVGTTPNASYGINAYTTATNGRAVYGYAAGSSVTNNYGVYGYASATLTNSYGVLGSAAGSGTTNYGIYGTATGATTNWAGYFASGNVYIANNLGIATTPSHRLHVSGNTFITGGLGVGTTANTTSGNIRLSGNIGINAAPSYRLRISDLGTSSQYSQYVNFRSTYVGDKAAIYGRDTSIATTDAGAFGVIGSASGSSSVGWNIGVHGWADNNHSQTVGVWGEARGGDGYSSYWRGAYGGFFWVTGGTGNRFGIHGGVSTANVNRMNAGVRGGVSIHDGIFTDGYDNFAHGLKGEVSIYSDSNYAGNIAYVSGSSGTIYFAPGTNSQRIGFMAGGGGGIYNEGTIRNNSTIIGQMGHVGGTGLFRDSTTTVIGVWGGVSHPGDPVSPTFDNVRVVGVYGQAHSSNTNTLGRNYGFHGTAQNARSNYGAYFWAQAGTGNNYGLRVELTNPNNYAGTNYAAYVNPYNNVDYGLFIESGATTSLYVQGTAVFTGNISAPNKGAAVSDVVRNDSGEVLREGDVVVLSGDSAVHYIFDGKIPVPRVRKSQGSSDGNKLFGVMYQSYTGERYEIQPEEYGFAFTLNAIRKVNVSGENGAIAVGDQLSLAEVPGHVKKANPGENVLGLALRSHNSSGLGQISVFVQLQYNNQTVTETDSGTITAGTISGDLGISGNLTVGGNIDVTGTLKAASLWSQNATWHLDSQGQLFVQKVKTQDLEIAAGENKSLGTATLPAESSEIFVANTKVTADSRIFLTIEGEGEVIAGVKIKEKTPGEGFVIATGDDSLLLDNLDINWLIIN